MWKRQQRESFGQDLYDTADDLLLWRHLMTLSGDLAKSENPQFAQAATRMVLTFRSVNSNFVGMQIA